MNINSFVKNDIKRFLIHNRYRMILCVIIVFSLMAAFYMHTGVISSVRIKRYSLLPVIIYYI